MPLSGAPSEAGAPAGVEAAFRAALLRLLGGERRLALAVSGGSDSTALLLLCAGLRGELGLELYAATVDHGLRAEARGEAEAVAALCARLGVPHEILTWSGEKPSANIQAAARAARLALLADWRRRIGAPTLALGHTLDDVAETFLIRLSRGSGVDGLARMAEIREEDPPLRAIRPLLGLRRADLMEYCRSAGVGWAEDPSNEDERFLRARARAALETLAPLGLGPERLARTAETMARARRALETEANKLLRAAATVESELGLLRLDPATLSAAPRELSLRALARALEWASGQGYPPRLEALEAALDALLSGGAGRSLHGALLSPEAWSGRWTLHREPAAAAPPARVENGEAVWDNRFRVILLSAAPGEESALGALGEAGRIEVERRLEQEGRSPPPAWSAAPLEARRVAPALLDASGGVVSAPSAGLAPEIAVLSPLRDPAWESHTN